MIPGMRIEEIVDALVSGYDRDTLKRMLRFRLGKRLDDLVGSGGLIKVVTELVELSEREEWTHDLVREAHRFNPGNSKIARIYQMYGLATFADLMQGGQKVASNLPVTDSGFELAAKTTIPQVGSALFRFAQESMENRVCRIELDGSPLRGTGFLVGPSVVLTNFHVMRSIIADKSLAPRIIFRFDFKELPGKTTPSERVVRLANDWLVDYSLFSPAEDSKVTPGNPPPTADQLDYALIRIDTPLGGLPVNSQATEGPRRGWIKIREVQPSITPKMPILILQHPEGESLKLAIDTDAVIGFNENHTRVRYTTNTERGSSGSPCFDIHWNIIALHHYGDASYGHPPFNQGVPINVVYQRLVKEGKAGDLGGDPP